MTTGPAPEHVSTEQALAELVEGISEDADTITMADAVAARLIAGGHQGQRGMMFECPVARYLRARTGQAHSVSKPYAGTDKLVELPPAVSAFVDRYDGVGDNYPELEPEGGTEE